MKVKRRWDKLVFGQNKGQGDQLPQEQEAMERGVRTVPLLQPSLKIITLETQILHRKMVSEICNITDR